METLNKALVIAFLEQAKKIIDASSDDYKSEEMQLALMGMDANVDMMLEAIQTGMFDMEVE